MRVVHCKKEKFDVYIGRPSKWGNPFVLGRDGDRETIINKYRMWLSEPKQKSLVDDIEDNLENKILGCWCSPLPCHGDVILEIAQSDYTVYCPRCKCIIGIISDWDSHVCPSCHLSYWFEERCTEDFSDCWQELYWDT